MKRLILLCLLCSVPSFAAITAATTWEVRTTGANTNGGGFDATISGAGTDMSIFDNKNVGSCTSCQSATVNISTTDAVTNNTTTVTSATGNFSSALIGNTIYLTGTGTTTAEYQVTAVGSSTSITVDRATGSTGGTGVTMNIGGALGGASTNNCFSQIGTAANNTVVPGNIVYIKATATCSINASTTFTQSGSSGLPINFIGYTTTRGDGGQVTVQTSSSAVNIFGGNGNWLRFRNFILNCASLATTRGTNLTGSQLILANIKATNCTATAFAISGNQVIARNNWATGNSCAASTGVYHITGTGNVLEANRATANTCSGFWDTTNSTSTMNTFLRNISDNNTGATTDGFYKSAGVAWAFYGNVAYTNGRDGVRFDAATALDSLIFRNNIIYGNVGVGINSITTDYSRDPLLVGIDYNAVGGNGTARTKVPIGTHDVALTGDPFTNGASNDFTLNNTASQGAACRAAGTPAALQSGGTGHLDIGALQHQDSGGAATTRMCASVQ